MASWRELARARNQLYDLNVWWIRLKQEHGDKHPTPQLTQLFSIIDSVISEAQEAFMAGHVLDVHINRYEPLRLPGFEELIDTPLDILNGVEEWTDGVGDNSILPSDDRDVN